MITNTAKLSKSVLIADSTFEIQFETDQSFIHEAGQFVTFKIPTSSTEPTMMRSYSISSRPQNGKFDLCIKKVENGRGSSYISALKEGENVEFMGPFGHFTFQENKTKNHLFIGTGTGIAPLKSIIENELSKKNNSPIRLLFGVRYIKDLFYKDLFEKLSAENPNFTYEIMISRPEDASWDQKGGKTGRVTDILRTLEIASEDTDAYICGLKEMVLETTQILEEKGLTKENIHFERFN